MPNLFEELAAQSGDNSRAPNLFEQLASGAHTSGPIEGNPSDPLPADNRRTGEKIQDATLPYLGVNASSALAAGADTVGTVADFVKKGALPTLGQIGGAALGTMAAPFAGPLAPAMPLAGGSAGGAAGEWLNQKLGITEPSNLQIGLAGATPAIVQGAIGATNYALGEGARILGGRATMGNAAGDIVAKWVKPAKSSQELLAEMKGVTADIPTFQAAKVTQDILKEEAGNIPVPVTEEIKKIIEPLAAYFQPGKNIINTLQMKELQTASRRLGGLVDEYRGTPVAGAVSKVRDALINDTDNVGVSALREFNKSYRIEQNTKDMRDILIGPNPLQHFRRQMDNSNVFAKTFEKDAPQIEKLIGKLTTVAASGGSGVMGRTILGAFGNKVAGPIGAVSGAIAPDLAAAALSTKAGQKFLEHLLVGDVWTAPKTAALAQFVRAQTAKNATTQGQ